MRTQCPLETIDCEHGCKNGKCIEKCTETYDSCFNDTTLIRCIEGQLLEYPQCEPELTCSHGVCKSSCFNGKMDGNETGVDCGGPCTPCQSCRIDDDCNTGFCDSARGYQCAERCTSDADCEWGPDAWTGQYCREDGRCASWGYESSTDQAIHYTDCNVSQSYPVFGEYHVKIRGKFEGWSGGTSNAFLMDVLSFGPIGLGEKSFADASNLNSMPSTDIPHANLLNNTIQMFAHAQRFNQPLGKWDMRNVTDLDRMFFRTEAFNQPIGNWNTGKVTDMMYMFSEAHAFNQDIGNWNTENVTEMSGMFSNAKAFDQDISDWDVSKIDEPLWMFSSSGMSQENFCQLKAQLPWSEWNDSFLGLDYDCP